MGMKSLLPVALRLVLVLYSMNSFGQSASFSTFMNPVIPGDHSDCTLTRIGRDFYSTGSSFNPTPVIYHSTDLIHWEAIAQPVSAAWSNYGDSPAGGCWGGQIVFYNGKYWDFFGRAFIMYFVTADKPEGPWSGPVKMNCPPSVPGLGADNSIFIDSDSTWYLLVKNGQPNNWIIQLGKDGQPAGQIYNLTWLNPAPSYPYSWAEGPVMWKHNGFYYYSFALNVAGGQKVMRSRTLTGDSAAWTFLGDLFNENDPYKPLSLFQGPNHSSAAVMLDDSTSWVMHPVWRRANNNEWYGQGRQGLVNQVHYDANNKPVADYPVNSPKTAPRLPSSGIPWMVPKSDYFESARLNPEWSFLGYTPLATWSLTERPGWLRLKPRSNSTNTVIKTDAEHNYSLIARLDFNATAPGDEAGIRIINGMQNLYVKLCSTADSTGQKAISFSFDKTRYLTINTIGSTLWLKLVRVNHSVTAFFSGNGIHWTQLGNAINVASLDSYQKDYNGWCGNRQGLYVQNRQADFDLYLYRDAYTPILAECPANQYGTTRSYPVGGISVLDDIHNNDWALYAGVEFDDGSYGTLTDSVVFTASSGTSGGTVELWLDSLDTGTKIGSCIIPSTGSWSIFKNFSAKVDHITGRHDVYLKFTGTGSSKLFMLKWMNFISKKAPEFTSAETIDSLTLRVKVSLSVLEPGLPCEFSIIRNDTDSIPVTAVILSPADSSEIILTLGSPLRPGDRISVSYVQGNILSYEGMELLPFTGDVTNSLVADYVPVRGYQCGLKLFPNPCGQELTIAWEPGFNKMLICNMQGRVVQEKSFRPELKETTQVLRIPGGAYLVQLQNDQAHISSKLQVK